MQSKLYTILQFLPSSQQHAMTGNQSKAYCECCPPCLQLKTWHQTHKEDLYNMYRSRLEADQLHQHHPTLVFELFWTEENKIFKRTTLIVVLKLLFLK